MTGNLIQFSLPGMAGPGKRKVTSSAFKDAVTARTKKAREDAGLTLEGISARLTERVGREVPSDTYRKYEKDAFIPHDLIIAFCDITKVHPYWLFDPSPFAQGQSQPFRRRSAA